MGHLSNPIGFRLTFEKKWNFTFFVKNIYYPEVINTLINLRDYIYYYLTRKKVLQSGVSLSHFMLSKHFKKYYIKIFIYHIDLEKTGYDLMNKFYHMYYALYNEITHKYDKNKTEKQVKLYHYLRDLSNSDIYIYLFVYTLFYKGDLKEKTFFLKDNLYYKNVKMKNYYKLIVYTFFKQFLNYYLKKKKNFSRKSNLKLINTKMKLFYWMNKLKKINKLNNSWSIKNLKTLEKNIKIAKIKGLILYKAKKWIKSKPLTYYMVQKCDYLKKRVLSSIQQCVIKLAWRITQKSIKNKIKQQHIVSVNIIKENQLLQNALQKFKENYKNFFWVGKYKKHKILKLNTKKLKKLNKKVKKRIFKLKEILFDKAWNSKFHIVLKNSVNSIDLKTKVKVDPFTLFFFLSKKTGFKKVDNTYTLWKKWTIVFKYMQLFNDYNFLYKDLFYYNINYFFFYMKTVILLSSRMFKITKTRYGNFLNLRNFIFTSLQQGIYITYFRSTLIWLNIFLKIGLSIIHNSNSLNKIDFNQLILLYYFISNNNVTAPFLARYIVLKLKRGFTVVKTLNPLKRELIRVSKKSRNTPYSNYLTTYVMGQYFIQKKLKKLTVFYKKSCKNFYHYFFVKFYNNNNIIITPNLFSYILLFNKKIKKRELSFSKIWRSNLLILLENILFNYIKYFLYKKTYKNNINKIKVKIIVKKFKFFFNLLSNSIIYIQAKLFLLKNIKFRYGLWLFFLSFFRSYDKKKKYRSYKQKLKRSILKSYQIYHKFNNKLYIALQLNKIKIDILEAKHKIYIYNSNFFSIYNLCNNLFLYKNKKKYNVYKITFSNFFNKHYINYSLLKTLWNIFNNVNLRNERDLYIPKYKSLIMGFKMVLKGRFSRKQRASKITLIKGKVPLNTFNMKVDYSFAHITLKNSEISLKFYLYKALGYEIYKRYLII